MAIACTANGASDNLYCCIIGQPMARQALAYARLDYEAVMRTIEQQQQPESAATEAASGDDRLAAEEDCAIAFETASEAEQVVLALRQLMHMQHDVHGAHSEGIFGTAALIPYLACLLPIALSFCARLCPLGLALNALLGMASGPQLLAATALNMPHAFADVVTDLTRAGRPSASQEQTALALLSICQASASAAEKVRAALVEAHAQGLLALHVSCNLLRDPFPFASQVALGSAEGRAWLVAALRAPPLRSLSPDTARRFRLSLLEAAGAVMAGQGGDPHCLLHMRLFISLLATGLPPLPEETSAWLAHLANLSESAALRVAGLALLLLLSGSAALNEARLTPPVQRLLSLQAPNGSPVDSETVWVAMHMLLRDFKALGGFLRTHLELPVSFSEAAMLRLAEVAANAKVVSLEAASLAAACIPPVKGLAAASQKRPLGLDALHALLQSGSMPAAAGAAAAEALLNHMQCAALPLHPLWPPLLQLWVSNSFPNKAGGSALLPPLQARALRAAFTQRALEELASCTAGSSAFPVLAAFYMLAWEGRTREQPDPANMELCFAWTQLLADNMRLPASLDPGEQQQALDRAHAVLAAMEHPLTSPSRRHALLQSFLGWWQRLPASLTRRLTPGLLRVLSPPAGDAGAGSAAAEEAAEGQAMPLQVLAVTPQAWADPMLARLLLHILHQVLAGEHQLLAKLAPFAQPPLAAEDLPAALLAQDSAVVQMLLEVCAELHPASTAAALTEASARPPPAGAVSEVQSLICAFLHAMFLRQPLLVRLVHMQGYRQELVPLTTSAIPSLHVCLDFLPDLLASAQPQQALFGTVLTGHLARRYPLPATKVAAQQALARAWEAVHGGDVHFGGHALLPLALCATTFTDMEPQVVELIQVAHGAVVVQFSAGLLAGGAAQLPA
ncbi:hypothetical protein WJX72_005679 [[Myrmecia] bisecta]|uniref:Uncharacterized protein n=1 Tax=[Myrmecia] bisecta TaxID=41462 RepID=A0AAW1QRH6_9CHLO